MAIALCPLTRLLHLLTVRSLRRDLVQRKVQLQHVHPRLSQKPELPRLGMLADRFANYVFPQPSFVGDARYLKFRRLG